MNFWENFGYSNYSLGVIYSYLEANITCVKGTTDLNWKKKNKFSIFNFEKKVQLKI